MERVENRFSLYNKILEELKNPEQLLDSERRKALIQHTMNHARTFVYGVSARESTKDILETELRIRELGTGGFIAFSQSIPLGIVMFPDDTKTKYVNPYILGIHQATGDASYITISTTTTEVNNQKGKYPSEGMKIGSKTYVPFTNRNPESQVQHGGIVISSETGKVEIVNYPELLDKIKIDDNNTVIIEANWYIDSQNQNEVLGLANLQKALPFNAIGTLTFNDGRKNVFTISSYTSSIRNLMNDTKMITDVRYRHVMLYEMAECCNLIAESLGASKWNLAGLEYNGGGSYSATSQVYKNDFFTHSF